MADYVISNLTTAVEGTPTDLTYEETVIRKDSPLIVGKTDGYFKNPLRGPNDPGGTKSIKSISFDDFRTEYLPDSKSFVSMNDSQDRPASGQLYPRFTK